MLRRNFIKLSAASAAAMMYSRLTYATSLQSSLINYPDEVWAQLNDQWFQLTRSAGTLFTYKDVQVDITVNKNAQSVQVQSPETELQAIRLKWKYDTGKYTKVLGDHWERSYGDLGWKEPVSTVKNPWYVLLNDGLHTVCFGVKTGAASLCWWTVNHGNLELTMDTHSGGVGVKLGQRKLHAADIVTMDNSAGENAYHTATRFCKVMCEHPRLPKHPVYGINDWYVAYGNNSYASIRDQTAVMATLMPDSVNRPFSVIDDGWQIADDFSKVNDKFKDMQKLAEEIKGLGMRPGLWTRPLIAKLTDKHNLLAPNIPNRNDPKVPILDPTIPENIERVKYNMSVYQQWGYELVKHDYSSYDIFGKWGFNMNNNFTSAGWKFYDQSRTNAELVTALYRAIRESAGDLYVIGCNTISHLSAGLFELNRTGDDTSGKEWARTRKMGVNTLGFRLPQHNTFYAVDGDCVGLTKDVPWEKNKQWLQLLARSGSALFVSADLKVLGAEQKAVLKEAFSQASNVQITAEPLDWMNNQWPDQWKFGKEKVQFNWD